MYRDRAPSLTTVYWLIENPETGLPGELTVRIDAGTEALLVFSYPEEAEMFLRLGGLEERGWRIVACTAGELVSRLPGYRRTDIDLVALDPLPEMMGSALDTTIGLVTLSLQGFARRHTARPREELARG